MTELNEKDVFNVRSPDANWIRIKVIEILLSCEWINSNIHAMFVPMLLVLDDSVDAFHWCDGRAPATRRTHAMSQCRIYACDSISRKQLIDAKCAMHFRLCNHLQQQRRLQHQHHPSGVPFCLLLVCSRSVDFPSDGIVVLSKIGGHSDKSIICWKSAHAHCYNQQFCIGLPMLS